MDSQQKWLDEVMGQNINASLGKDYTRLAFNFFFINYNLFENTLNFNNLCSFIYRFYIDNSRFAQINPSPLIKNIKHYKPSDLKEYIYEQIMIWKKNQNSLLRCNREIVKIDGNILLNKEFYNKYVFVIKMLFKRYLKEEFFYDDRNFEKIDIELSNVEYLKCMKESRLRNRMFEYINYCPLCDEIDDEKLNAIHINYIKELNNIYDIDNIMLLCDKHCNLYLNGYFKFKENGYIEILRDNKFLDSRMHLGIGLLNLKRKKYIKESH